MIKSDTHKRSYDNVGRLLTKRFAEVDFEPGALSELLGGKTLGDGTEIE